MAKSKRRTRRSKSGSSRVWVVVLTAALVLGVGFLAHASNSEEGTGSHHPTPREGITAAKVMPAARYARIPRIEKIYREVAQVPEEVDGVYCYCHCIENMGHYSLLTCFESDHASGCHVCLGEGDMVYRLSQRGMSLDQIRQTIDRTFSG